MRKAIGILAFLLIASQAVFAFDPDELNRVTFVNTTGATITGLFLSPGDSGEWGPEILGSERTLDPKAQLAFFLHYPEETGTFDIMAIDENNKSYLIFDYTFEDGQEEIVQFRAKDATDDPPDVTYVELTLENALDYDVYFLFLSPSDSEMWGADILDEETILSAGDSVSFYVPVGEDSVSYDVAAVDEDGDEYQFSVEMDASEESYSAAIEASDYVED